MRLFLSVAILLVGCSALPPAPPAPPEVQTEQTFSDCELACQNMAELGCDIAEPDEDGSTCVEICDWTQEQGLVDLEPELLAEATECPD